MSARSKNGNDHEEPFVVAQLGARMHYAVPAIFHRAGRLAHFYTDICAAKGWPRLLPLLPVSLMPNNVRRLAARMPKGVPSSLLTHFPSFGLGYASRLRSAKTAASQVNAHLWAGRTFAEKILACDPPERSSLFCFNTAALELLQAWGGHTGIKVLEQSSAAKRVESALVREEFELHPGWEHPPATEALQEELADREEAEWALADIIICGSEWVRSTIETRGGPVQKCVVVPYGINTDNFNAEGPSWNGGSRKLRVLTVGNVELQKGVADVLSTAARLQARVEFRVVGGVRLLPEAAERLQMATTCTGIVPRSEVHEHFKWADVFLFPSRSEGSATVTYEALAAGLPVITTLNSGSIVEDGLSGFIVPVGDVEAIVERLERFMASPKLLQDMTHAAAERSRFGTVEAYGERLLKAVTAGGPIASQCDPT